MLLTILTYFIKVGYYICTLLTIGVSLHYALNIKRMHIRGMVGLGLGCVVFLIGRLIAAHAQLVGSIEGFYSADMYDWVWIANQNMVLMLLAGLILLLISYTYKHKWSTLLGTFLLAYSYGMSGHTVALEDPFLAPYIVGFHILIAGFWIAAPISLWPNRQSPESILNQTEKFSNVAMWAIPLLFVSGIWLLYQITGSITAALTTAYGQVLIAKFIGAFALMGVGAINKTLVTKKLAQNAPTGVVWLKMTLTTEAFFFIVVVGLISAATVFVGPKH